MSISRPILMLADIPDQTGQLPPLTLSPSPFNSDTDLGLTQPLPASPSAHPSLRDLEWVPHPEFWLACNTAPRLDGVKDYIFRARRRMNDSSDITSFHPGQAHWTPTYLQSCGVLVASTPPSDFANVERHPSLQEVRHLRDPETNEEVTKYIYRRTEPTALRDLPILPRQISVNVESWRLEAWRRLDPRIHWEDIMLRMYDHKEYRDRNSLNTRVGRWRREQDPPLESWHGPRRPANVNSAVQPTANRFIGRNGQRLRNAYVNRGRNSSAGRRMLRNNMNNQLPSSPPMQSQLQVYPTFHGFDTTNFQFDFQPEGDYSHLQPWNFDGPGDIEPTQPANVLENTATAENGSSFEQLELSLESLLAATDDENGTGYNQQPAITPLGLADAAAGNDFGRIPQQLSSLRSTSNGNLASIGLANGNVFSTRLNDLAMAAADNDFGRPRQRISDLRSTIQRTPNESPARHLRQTIQAVPPVGEQAADAFNPMSNNTRQHMHSDVSALQDAELLLFLSNSDPAPSASGVELLPTHSLHDFQIQQLADEQELIEPGLVRSIQSSLSESREHGGESSSQLVGEQQALQPNTPFFTNSVFDQVNDFGVQLTPSLIAQLEWLSAQEQSGANNSELIMSTAATAGTSTRQSSTVSSSESGNDNSNNGSTDDQKPDISTSGARHSIPHSPSPRPTQRRRMTEPQDQPDWLRDPIFAPFDLNDMVEPDGSWLNGAEGIISALPDQTESGTDWQLDQEFIDEADPDFFCQMDWDELVAEMLQQ